MDYPAKIKWLLPIASFFLLSACSGVSKEIKALDEQPQATVVTEEVSAVKDVPMPETPHFDPVSEDISPLAKRVVCISVRNTPFRDVIKVVADAANLNLVLQKGVNTEVPVTVTLNNVTVKDALDIIFSSVDYFYEVNRNLLVVKAQETMIFEFGHPSVINTYSMTLGGDILGGSSGGSSTPTSIKGDISVTGKSDEKARNLWDEINDSIGKMLKSDDGSVPKGNFSINRITGTVVVTGSKKALNDIGIFLGKVKESLNRQVMIEARVVEVQLSKGMRFGIDWRFLDNYKNRFSVTAGTTNFAAVVPETGPVFDLGTVSTNFASVLNALQSQGDVKVLSNPRVSLMNGQTALLSVGRNVNFISKVQTTTTAATTGTIPQTTFTIETSSVLSGIIIGIVPYINPEGNVSLTITPIVSDLINLENKNLGTVGENNITVSLPTIDLREMTTTVKVKNEEMVVIGGLINKKEVERDNGIPLISRIPILGLLFKSKEKTEERTELVIMLKPVVTNEM